MATARSTPPSSARCTAGPEPPRGATEDGCNGAGRHGSQQTGLDIRTVNA